MSTLRLSPADWHHRTHLALEWVLRSIDACDGQGSAHSWSPLLGWSRAYPETTGYLLETLLDYLPTLPDPLHEQVYSRTRSSAEWLLRIQHADGAYAGLLAGHSKPSVFNTAQILFGLTRCHETQLLDIQTLAALRRATEWLLATQETDGSWQAAAYVEGFEPTYYTRVVWGILRANSVLQNPKTHARMQHTLRRYAQRIGPDGWLHEAGFWANKPAFSHTIAYALEGLLESAVLLHDADTLRQALRSADFFLQKIKTDGTVAGRYAHDGSNDLSFRCLTGLCQMSLVYRRAGQLTGQTRYTLAADDLLAQALEHQVIQPAFWQRPARGALAGSSPLWGAYLPFRYPNWAVKFLLDALWSIKPQQPIF
jgi:hypothetical protein